MLPAISFAYERAESDLMQRKPRNKFVDRLVTKQLIGLAYLQIGIIQATAGFCAFFATFEYYGIKMTDLVGMSGWWRNENLDTVGAVRCCGGRCNGRGNGTISTSCGDESDFLFDTPIASCLPGAYAAQQGFCDPEGRDLILRRAQTAFLSSIVVVQWADLIICKTRLNKFWDARMVRFLRGFD